MQTGKTKDDDRRIHSYLAPCGSLTGDAKEHDRDNIELFRAI